MACSVTTIKTNACTSGIGKLIDPIQLLQIIAQLTCEAATGAAGSGSVLSGAADPVADPGVSDAIYTNTTTGTQFTWFLGAWH